MRDRRRLRTPALARSAPMNGKAAKAAPTAPAMEVMSVMNARFDSATISYDQTRSGSFILAGRRSALTTECLSNIFERGLQIRGRELGVAPARRHRHR